MEKENSTNTQTTNQTLVEEKTARKGFRSKLGFVLAAAGSAVGLGNLWRFPYLAAKYGGGIFILCYVILAVTIGFTLLTLEISIGRNTGKGVLGAFKALSSRFKWFGYVCLIVPIMIVPYYCVIGGWVAKYVFSFAVGELGPQVQGQVDPALFFNTFIQNPWQPVIFFVIFALCTIGVVVFGVQKGIEKMSKIFMPVLTLLCLGLMVYVLFQDGALNGVKFLLVPDFKKFSVSTILAAMGQLFYSMSLAMCIMITYGSYMKKEDSIKTSARQISLFDSGFAIFAAMVIIPSIFAFSSDPEGALQSSGPSLMFIRLTEVFSSMPGGRIIGAIFFLLVFLAALTSSISLAESIVAILCEDGKMSRFKACCIVFGAIIVLGLLSSLGYTQAFEKIYIVIKGDKYFILDIFDFVSNNFLMPIVAIITCIIAGFFVEKDRLPDEIGIPKKKLSRGYYRVMVRFVAPICIFLILITGLFFNL